MKNHILKIGAVNYIWNITKTFKHITAEKKDLIAKLRNNTQTIKTLRKIQGLSFPIYRLGYFSECCEELGREIAADVYITVTEMPLLSAHSLASKYNGKVYCDAVEHPYVDQRSLKPNWHERMFLFYNAANETFLRKCDGLITVSHALGKFLNSFGPPVKVIENFRWSEKKIIYRELREKCGVGDQDILLLAIGHVVKNFRTVLHALKLLPENIHLAALVKIKPDKYRQQCENLIKKFSLEKRVHFFDYVPYDQLTKFASGADIGLVMFNPEILNHAVGLPNRVFDYIFSGLPICSLDIPDISYLIQKYDIGKIVRQHSPKSWAESINSIIKEKTKLHNNVLLAAQELTWESREKPLLDFLNHPGSVTFLGIRDLTNYNRVGRMSRTMAEAGIDVKIVTTPLNNQDKIKASHPNISYYCLPIKPL